jgi:hypothetical protein
MARYPGKSTKRQAQGSRGVVIGVQGCKPMREIMCVRTLVVVTASERCGPALPRPQLPRSHVLGLRQVHSTPESLCAARGCSMQRRSAVSGTPP